VKLSYDLAEPLPKRETLPGGAGFLEKTAEGQGNWRRPSTRLLHMRPLPVQFAALRGLGMIKKIESYPELADPQLQPRYSGIPTFLRLRT
jgi:hypothetical protein